MDSIFYIAPVHSDKDFRLKWAIVHECARKCGLRVTSGMGFSSEHWDLEIAKMAMDKADFFVADLSFERPSCYYEVGYLQGRGIPGLVLALESSKIHQVLGPVLSYSDLESFERTIKSGFLALLEDVKV